LAGPKNKTQVVFSKQRQCNVLTIEHGVDQDQNNFSAKKINCCYELYSLQNNHKKRPILAGEKFFDVFRSFMFSDWRNPAKNGQKQPETAKKGLLSDLEKERPIMKKIILFSHINVMIPRATLGIIFLRLENLKTRVRRSGKMSLFELIFLR